MNHVYRLTWNESLQQYVPAPETARGRHKQGGRARRRLAGAAVAAALLGAAAGAQALPAGGQVSSGTASITASITPGGATLTLRQSSQQLAVNWQAFNIAGNETVNFVQPNASAIALNRVLGSDASAIYGKLNANGQVFLLNPNGILFGKSAEVNVGGLLASTLNLSDADFVAGKRTFGAAGGAGASVSNLGRITADGGYIAFLGARVSNQGTLQANLGTVALAAGQQSTLDFAGDKLIKVQVDQGALNALAENGQLMQADGGSVILTARAADSLVSAVVNNSGLILARTLENHAGVISLLGDMRSGQVRVGGMLDASAPDGGNGGFIETSAATVKVAADARVTTAAPGGRTGNWLIDPQDYTVAASGGDISGAALGNNLGSTNVTLQSSSGGAAALAGTGNVNVNDAVTWNANTTLTLTASNHVNVNAAITATGAAAGLAINPNTANGTDAASGAGVFNLGAGASINLPNVSAGSTTALVIGGTPYTVLNSLGVAGDMSGATLQGINGNLSGHYALGSNIDAAATAAWDGHAGFTPIGAGLAAFSGTFDGLGHAISGLTIKAPSINVVGLFGAVGSADALRSLGTVQNVGLVGATVTASAMTTQAGALVGVNYGTLSDVYVIGSVTGSSNVSGQIGALVGYNAGTIRNAHAAVSLSGAGNYYVGGLSGVNDGTLSNVYATGSVAGGSGKEVGGLAGENNGTIVNAYATGSSSGSADVGGLVGINYAVIGNAYATGSVSGTNRVGGLVGNNAGTISYAYAKGSVGGSSAVGGLVGQNNANSTVSNAYATGGVSGTTSVGALAGVNRGTISNAYWNSDVKAGGIGSSAGAGAASGKGLTSVQMRTASNLAGLSFTSTAGGAGWVMIDADGTLNNAGGAAGATTPMLASEYSGTVSNAHQLQLMAMAPAANYVLGSAIDATATAGARDVWGSAGFVPVGSLTAPFAGTFNGGSLTVNALTINAPLADNVGLFGTISGGTVQNLGLTGGSIVGHNFVGELAGTNGGTIMNVYASGSVSGANNVGALVGMNAGGISDAYATGSISGKIAVGGLVGNNGGTINYVYATGSVKGTSDVGALVGNNSGTLGHAAWNLDVNPTGIETDSGAGTTAWGLTTAQMQTQANFTSATSVNGNINPAWDFGATWFSYDGRGAPLLRSFLTPLTVTANAATKIYNGQAYSGYGVSYSATPDARLLGTSSFGGAAQGATNVGTYTIAPGGLYSTQQGYAIDFVGSALKVTPATLTVSGTVATDRVYDGSTAVTLSGGTLMGLVSGDAVTLFQSGTTATRNARSGIAVTASDTLGGAAAGNYILIQPAGLSANITAKTLTVDGTLALNKVYDGSSVATLSAGILNGEVAGDTLTLVQSGNFATKNVGAAIAVSTINTLGGASAGNYILSAAGDLVAAITAKQLTVGGTANGNKIYDGSTAVALNGGNLSGVIAGDTLGLAQAGTFADKNAGKSKVLSYKNTLTGADLGNYSLASAGGTTRADILVKDLTVQNVVALSKVYDGSSTATLSASLSGLIAGDAVSLVQSGTFASKNVGTAKIVMYKNSLAGTDNGNYQLLSAGGTAAADIIAKALTVSGTTVAGKAYDGTTKASLTGGTLIGLVGGEKVSLSQAGVFTTKNAGSAVAVTATDSLRGAAAANYILIEPTQLVASITPKLLKVSAAKAANKVYDGNTTVALSGSKLTGLVAGDTVGLVQAGVFDNKNVGKAKTVFYSNSLSGADAANYSVPVLAATIKANITALQLSVSDTTTAADKIYDGTTAATVSGATIDGVLLHDSVLLAQSGSFANNKIGAGKLVNYTNTLTGRDAGNYTLSEKKGKTTAEISE